MALASDAIRSARIYLNDLNGITWSDTLLMPLLQEAHAELIQELELNNLNILKIQTAPILVTAGTKTLPSQPSNILNPISMYEAQAGATDFEQYMRMAQANFLPMVDSWNELHYWAWIGQVITFLGATVDRSVILQYEGSIVTPQKLTDSLGVIFAERYIGPRITALAHAMIGKDNTFYTSLAANNLYKLIQSLVTNNQRPVRRRGFRDRRSGFGPVSVIR